VRLGVEACANVSDFGVRKRDVDKVLWMKNVRPHVLRSPPSAPIDSRAIK